ncbi:MAG: FliH/SctL family protein [Candidatus Cloacimonadota bacterium]|nr:FliH/SctL family protein [Candidatus Cloacimonadota bacterium]
MKIIKSDKVKETVFENFNSTLPDFSDIMKERKKELEEKKKSEQDYRTPLPIRQGFTEKFDKIEKLYDIKVKRAYNRGLNEGAEKAAKEITENLSNKYENKIEELIKNNEQEIKELKQVNIEKVDLMFRDFENQIDVYKRSFVNIAENYHKETVKISLAIMKKIMVELSDKDKNLISRNILKSLNKIDKKIPCILKLNPDDLKYFKDNSSVLEELAERKGYKTENIELIPDESIEKGGCVVETDSFVIDARLSEQFENLKKALKENYISF